MEYGIEFIIPPAMRKGVQSIRSEGIIPSFIMDPNVLNEPLLIVLNAIRIFDSIVQDRIHRIPLFVKVKGRTN